MDAALKKQLISRLKQHDHGHESMTDAAKCSSCGTKFQNAKVWYERMRREKPELFKRKAPEIPDSPELNDMRTKLADRLKRDPMYKKHLELSFRGTPAERKRENDRANSGYYTKHSDYKSKKWL